MSALAAALLATQKAMPAIHKDSKAEVVSKKTGAKFSYTYLSLQALLETVLPVLNDNGLALSQTPTFHENGAQSLRTSLLHESGETLESDTPLILTGELTPQTWGGAVTYARRYAISALLGIAADEDDDAQAASRPKKSQAAEKRRDTGSGAAATSPSRAVAPDETSALITEVAALRKVDVPTVTQALIEQFGKPLGELGATEQLMAVARLKGWRDKAMEAA